MNKIQYSQTWSRSSGLVQFTIKVDYLISKIWRGRKG